jgi:anti-sigma B factor antagonist
VGDCAGALAGCLKEEASVAAEEAYQPDDYSASGIEPLDYVDGTGLFSVAVQQPDPAVMVIHVAGEMDMLTASPLHDRFSQLLATRPQRLIIDLNRVSFLGATGLSVLLSARDIAAQQGTALQLRGTNRRAVARALAITGLDCLFEILPPASGSCP